MVEFWAGDQRVAVHPRAQSAGQRFTLPGQWEGLPMGDQRPRAQALAVQVSMGQVERRPLQVYELAAAGDDRPGTGRAQHLETLGLKEAMEALDNSLDAAANRQLTYPEMLADLLGIEVSASQGSAYLTTRTRLAHLPFHPHHGAV